MELRLSVLIEHHQLTVDDPVRQLPKVRSDLGKEGQKVVATTGKKIEPLPVLDQQRSVAVVL